MTSLVVLPTRVVSDNDPLGVHNAADRGSNRGSGYWMTNAILRHCDRLFATWQLRSVVVPTAPWLRTTYASVVRDGAGALHVLYRGVNSANQWRLVYQRGIPSSNGVMAWQAPRVLASTANGTSSTTGYALYDGAIAIRERRGVSVIAVAYQLYDDSIRAARSWGYLQSNDGGNRWSDWHGTDVTASLPITASAAHAVHRAQSHPAMDVRVGNVAIDPLGNPWVSVLYVVQPPGGSSVSGHDTRLWRLRGGQWSTTGAFSTPLPIVST